MFCRLAYSDTLIIIRGLLILVLAILLGLSATEQQLNTLTERQEIGQIFAIDRSNEGVYSLEVIGSSYNISAMYAVAEIANLDSNISIVTPFHTLTIPKYIYIDGRKELAWIMKLIVHLEAFIKESKEKYNDYLQHFR